jgi:hypothetical protein
VPRNAGLMSDWSRTGPRRARTQAPSSLLAAAGVPIWIDAQARIAHAKTMVIDGAVTLMGLDELGPRRRGKLGRL